jgi:hypothetical protein
MKLRSAVAITVVLLAIIHAEHIAAVPSAMTHEMSGTVQRADRKTITILPTGSSKPVVFAWNSKETRFVRNGTPTAIDSLPMGAKVQIRCSHPILGSTPLLYRVSWHTINSQGETKSR